MSSVPRTRYAQCASGQVAYQVVGTGPDLVFSPWWWSNLDAQWDDPRIRAFLERLASFSRLILFDQRGVGLSDPVPLNAVPTLEEWMDDMRAVLDAAGSETAVVFGHGDGGLVSMLFAATFPERTSALILVDSCARLRQDGDYPGWLDNGVEFFLREFRTGWGSGSLVPFVAPDLVDDEDFRTRLARIERLSVSPTVAEAVQRVILDSDVRDVLATVSAPTLVLHRKDNAYAPAPWGRYLAAHIPGARYVEVAGAEHLYWLGATAVMLDEVEEFVTGRRVEPAGDRVLATVLFTDIVGSTAKAAELGDRRWTELLGRFRGMVRAHLERFGGREINTRGDDFLATFDGPARAIRCAHAVTADAQSIGIATRSGLHTGEVQVIEGEIGGITVHIGARVSAMAAPGEVLVSRTVVDLVAGSGLAFDDRGEHELKGVPGSWRVFAATG